MSIKLERDEYHSRTLALTGNDTLDEIAINYMGNATAHKGNAMDNEVIPAIVNAVNSHTALLEALESLARVSEYASIADYQAIARDAIAAAKGGD